MPNAQIVNLKDPKHPEILADVLLKGGIVGSIWGHHLYFLAGNAFNPKTVAKMNKIKGRPADQVLVSPGAVEEAEEFADFKKNKGLLYAAYEMKMTPRDYIEFLFRKFPLGIELVANKNAPASVTFATKNGKTIWIAGYMKDKFYSKFLDAVRALRKKGHKIIFAGASLNLHGNNTLTVKQLDQVKEEFEDKIDAISVLPGADKLKKLSYSTSCSSVSFISERPTLLRIGSTSVATLKKYIPGLIIPEKTGSTRK